jgi:hypothetical protein
MNIRGMPDDLMKEVTDEIITLLRMANVEVTLKSE